MGVASVALLAALLGCCGLPAPGSSLAAASAAGCPGATLQPTAADVRAAAATTLCLIDRLRVARHLKALRVNRALAAVAGERLASMLRLDYFSDTQPGGQTPMTLAAASGYRAHAAGYEVGEVVAWGTSTYSTPAHIVSAWMASPPHRELILEGAFHDAGVAVTAGVPAVVGHGARGATYAIEFGLRWF